MGKHTHRETQLQHIQGRRAEAFRQLTTGIPRDQILIAPLDIGKNVNWAAFHTGEGLLLQAPFAVSTLKAGYEQYVATLDRLIAHHQPRLVILGHEPTGIYHESWARNLLQRYAEHVAGHATPHLVYHFVNSYQVKLNRTQTTLAFDKTDLLDLGAIGDLLLRGLGFPAHLPTASDLLVRQEVESLRALQTEQQRVANRVLRTFDQLLPGAFLNSRRFTRAHPELAAPTPLATRPLERQLVEALILLCPNPYTLRDLGVPGLIDLFHAHGYRCGPQTAAKLLAVVARALLPPPEVAPAFAASVQREFQHYQFLAPQVAEALTHLDTLLPTTAARHLLDIPGTSAHLIARYLTGVGPLDNVLFADQVWRKAGMNPGRCSSGDVVLDGAMAKQGDPFSAIPSTAWAINSPGTAAISPPPFWIPLRAAKAKLRPPSTRRTRSTGFSSTCSNRMSRLTHPPLPTIPRFVSSRPRAWSAIWRKNRPSAAGRWPDRTAAAARARSVKV